MLCLVVVLALLWMVEGLRTSRIGRAMLAVRDNELEAQALGINVYKTKIVALSLGGMIAGLGGGFLAALLITSTPSAFQSPYAEVDLDPAADPGRDRGHRPRRSGAFFGAIALVVQQQVFAGADFFFAFFGIYSALVLILFLLFRPGGLLQVGRIQMELIRKRPGAGHRGHRRRSSRLNVGHRLARWWRSRERASCAPATCRSTSAASPR